ncbi:MAG: InlB B-repeat-containing protein, partial [Dehalococcoidia bacterium]|nr:InlB B-repeat-containing protein [Dehalococcoidia bacterium]
VAKGASATPPTNPTRDGYTFQGWYPSYTNVQSDLAVMAQYTEDTDETEFNVTFVDWDDVVIETQVVPSGGSATAPTFAGTKPGWTFVGWDKSYSNVTEDLIIRAMYTEDTDGTEPTISTVYYYPNGGTGSMPSETAVHGDDFTLSRNAFTRPGYTFTGWNTTPSGGALSYPDEYTFSPWTRNDDLTLYAQWAPNASVTVTFDKNTTDSTTGPAPTSKTVTYNSAYGTLASVSRAGYTFGGWYLNAACTGDAVTASTIVDNTDNHTLYAKWTPNTNISYTVHYYLQGTTVSVAQSKTVTGQTMGASVTENAITVAGYTALAPTTITRVLAASGNEFILYYSANAPTTTIPHTTAPPATIPHATNYTVTVNESHADNSGAGTYAAGDTVTINAGTRTGYTFSGWTVVSGGVTLANTSSTSTTFTMPPNDVTVTANWVPDTTAPITGGDNDDSDWKEWALVNLILCGIGVFTALFALVRVFAHKNNKQNNERRYTWNTNMVWLLATVIAAIAGVILFLFTENMRNPMALVDFWTLFNAVILLLGVIGTVFTFKQKLEDEETRQSA